jgi:hypothetical protein
MESIVMAGGFDFSGCEIVAFAATDLPKRNGLHIVMRSSSRWPC